MQLFKAIVRKTIAQKSVARVPGVLKQLSECIGTNAITRKSIVPKSITRMQLL